MSELLRVELQAHRLAGVGPRWSKSGHRLKSSVHTLFEIKTKAMIGSLQAISRDERSKKPSNTDAKPVASDGNIE